MCAGDVTRHGRQALEGLASVFEQSFGGDRHAVFALTPFAQQYRAGREVEIAWFCAQFDLRVFGTDARSTWLPHRRHIWLSLTRTQSRSRRQC